MFSVNIDLNEYSVANLRPVLFWLLVFFVDGQQASNSAASQDMMLICRGGAE